VSAVLAAFGDRHAGARRYHSDLVATRVLAGVLVVILALLGTAPVAAASAELTGSDPAQGATLATAPRKITLTFSEPVDPDLVVIFVTGGDGRSWRVGAITASGNTLTMPVTPAGPAGHCTVEYSIAGAAQRVHGSVRFTLTAAPPSLPPPTTTRASAGPTPAAGEPGPGSGGVPIWVWVLIGACIAGVGVGVMIAGAMRARGVDRT
jgi:copper resistance protein C